MSRSSPAVLVAWLVATAMAPAQPLAPTEYEVKAAFLYHFARYVEWPPDGLPADEAFVITVLGDDPFGPALDTILQGKRIHARRLVVRRVTHADQVGQTQILFIAESQSEDLPRILRRLESTPTLTVGEGPLFARTGGMIRFAKERDRVGFEINLASAERARLRISSQLLKLARIVGPASSA